MANGNRQWTIWVVGILATMILSTLTMTIKSVIANDICSRARDEKIELRLYDKIEENQKYVQDELSSIKDNQSRLIARQDMVIDTLKEIKQDIKKIQ